MTTNKKPEQPESTQLSQQTQDILDKVNRSAVLKGEPLRSVRLGAEGPYVSIATSDIIDTSSITGSRITDFNRDLGTLRSQLSQVQKELAEARTNNTQSAQIESLQAQVQQVVQTVAQVQVRGEELTAPVLIPTRQDLQVRLVPLHSLERLEEYRSDESKYSLFIGLFGGAGAGIIINWVTNEQPSEQFTVARSAIVLLILLVLLAVGCAYRAFQINRRAREVRARMLRDEPLQQSVKQHET